MQSCEVDLLFTRAPNHRGRQKSNHLACLLAIISLDVMIVPWYRSASLRTFTRHCIEPRIQVRIEVPGLYVSMKIHVTHSWELLDDYLSTSTRLNPSECSDFPSRDAQGISQVAICGLLIGSIEVPHMNVDMNMRYHVAIQLSTVKTF